MFKLVAKNKISLPKDDPAFASPEKLLERYEHFTGLDDFLHYHFLGMSVLVEAEDFEGLAMAYFQRAKRDGVMHAEVFFDPEAHTERGISFETVVAGFNAACKRAQKELGISTKLIVCVLRHLPVSSANQTFITALASGGFRNGTLAGLGISSTEIDKPPEIWKDIFLAAKEAGIRTTAHAGDEGPPDYIAAALDTLRVSRIDHGTRLPEDPALMKRVAEEGVMLTVCPISDLKLRGINNMEELPVRKSLDAGVKFSLNSDDPAYFRGYILDNYCAVQETFDLSMKEWELIVRNAIGGSWCGDERKHELVRALESCIKRFDTL